MDKLRNIDHLLKTSLENAEHASSVSSGDWLAIEKRLKQRKNRIYAMWFSLALIALTSIGWLLYPLSQDTVLANRSDQPEQTSITLPEQDIYTPNQIQEENAISPETSEVQPSLKTTPPYVSNQEVVSVEESTPKGLDSKLDEQLGTRVKPISELLQAIVEQVEGTPKLLEPQPLTEGVQQTKQKSNGIAASYWEIGISFTPSQANKWTSTNSALAGLINKSYFGILNSSEHAAFASSTSAHFSLHLPNGFYFGSGIGITQRTESVDYNYRITEAVFVNDVEKRIDYFALPTGQHVQIEYSGSNSYHFIEIPLTVGYKLPISNKLELRNEVSASYMLLTNRLGKKADYTYLTLTDLQDLTNLNTSNVAATFSSGLYYNFKNFVIGAEPTFSMNVTSLTNNQSALKITPYNYGLNLTTAIKLNRK